MTTSAHSIKPIFKPLDFQVWTGCANYFHAQGKTRDTKRFEPLPLCSAQSRCFCAVPNCMAVSANALTFSEPDVPWILLSFYTIWINVRDNTFRVTRHQCEVIR